MVIQPGDLLFVWGHGLVDKAIEMITDGPSHVAMFVDETTLAEAQGGRVIGEIALSAYLSSTARLEVWGDPELTNEQRAAMIEYAKTLYGTPYDYVLIPLEAAHFLTGLPLDWFHENKHRLCSSFVQKCAWQENRKWSQVENPAPVDLINGGVLALKGALATNTQSAS